MDTYYRSFGNIFIKIVFNKGYIFIYKGYHAVTYCLGIHLLNSFIGFISPLQDPEDEETSLEDKGSFLPQKYNFNL